MFFAAVCAVVKQRWMEPARQNSKLYFSSYKASLSSLPMLVHLSSLTSYVKIKEQRENFGYKNQKSCLIPSVEHVSYLFKAWLSEASGFIR